MNNYYIRDEDEKVRDFLEKEQSVLNVGSPLGGKTRMVYEALRYSKNTIIIPRARDRDIEFFILPKQLGIWKPKLMSIDDLHRFVESPNFEYLFEICRKKQNQSYCDMSLRNRVCRNKENNVLYLKNIY